jgi:hypothetical protein
MISHWGYGVAADARAEFLQRSTCRETPKPPKCRTEFESRLEF